MSEIAYNLYRVSTTKQVDKVKDDIPMQREACREFAQRMGWTVGKEFLEKGVSGFKVSATDRDAIQELKAAALRNEFQILLVFMFDRIGRIDDETPFVVEWFVKHGIRVWSVQEGEQRFESHVDKLMNYIRFWQASGESEKTSMRIKTRMQQLTAEGSYTGGGVPFGYQLEKRGRLNKRGKEIYDLVINPVEAEWVVEIFEKTVKYGYGSHRLATYLNENGVRTHSMVSGDTVSPHMKELQIIDEKMFERAQYILEQRAMKNSDERQIALSTKSQAMLSGVMFCAHCGGRMTSNMHTEKYTVKSTGEVKEKHYLRYICYHRSRKLCDCDGQSVYSAEKVDKAVIEVVASIFSKISDAPDEAELRKEYNKEMQKCRAKQTKLGTELKKYQKQYDKLNEEIANTLIGESFYSPEQLSTAMTTVQQRITAINQQLEKIGNEMEQKKASMEKVRPMYDMFKGWAEEFRMATIEQKKMIISQVISRIEIGKGYKINITLNMEYEQFCVGWNGLNNL
ncbi:recombinase family protein [Ruminococcus flavefaciens]|uniref:recombinase family protein n=1 Tax=Ruminococcus flavefaciens TaxID=1265 RepID=UPI0013DB550B|nr:recombinase family protein [Ruminococcus flavefaciens]